MAQLAPNVEIVEQPAEECRFRYEQECRTNGSILGANSGRTDGRNRTYPTIRVHNYVGPVAIRVSCVAKDPPYRPHPHKLVARANCEDGVCNIIANITERNPTVQFQNIGVQCTKKNKVTEVLQQRNEMAVDPFGTGYDPSTYSRLSLHHIRLAFEVFVQDPATNLCTVPLETVASRVITDHRRLCVVHFSEGSGAAAGGTQITLLTEKLTRGVSVQFFEAETGWQAPAVILQMHYMHALVIETPPYRDPAIRDPVNVSFYLSRPPSGDAALDRGCTSEPRPFTYTPERPSATMLKRPNPELLRTELAPKRPNDTGHLNLQNETINSPIANVAIPTFLVIPPPSEGLQLQDAEYTPAVAGPSHHDPLDWLQVGLIYPELRHPKPLQPVAASRLNEPPSTSRGRAPSTPSGMQAAHRIHTSEIGQVFAGQNHPLTDQSHGLVGQMGHAPSGLTHRPMRPTSQEHNISTVLSHAPIKRLPMSQSNNFAGQVKHGFTGRNQPPIAQPPMKHPVLFHTPVEHPPMSQSLDIGGQMAQALPDLHHLSMRPHAQDHNISLVQSHVSMEQVFPSRTHLPIDQSHGVGGQIRHFPQGLNHDPGDFFSGLNHGARIGLNKLDKPMSHTTFMEHDVPELPQHQEGHQEIIDQVSFDLDAEALSCLLEAPSTDCPSSELLSFSFLDEEIRVNLSGSISKLTTDSEFDGVSKDPC